MSDSKRKVDLISLDSSKDSSKKAKVDSDKSDTTKFDDYVFYADTSGELKEVNDIVKSYIKTLISSIAKYKDFNKFQNHVEAFITTIEDIKTKLPSFVKQKNFKNLIKAFEVDIQKSTSFEFIPDFNWELILELRRFLRPFEGKDETKNMPDAKVYKLVENITKAIQKFREQISILESREISYDDMNGDTGFTKLPRLQSSVVKLWRRREALLKRSDFTGRKIFRAFTYNGTTNSEVNQIVQDYYYKYLNLIKNTEDKMFTYQKKSKKKSTPKPSKKESKFSFFTIIELKDYLTREIEKANIDYVLTDGELTKIYKNLLDENRSRNMSDQFDSFRTLETFDDIKPMTTANEKDPEFIKEMDENGKKGKEKLENLIKEYREKDFEQNGKTLDESKPIGWDDQEESESDSTNDEESDSQDEDEEDEEEDFDTISDGEQGSSKLKQNNSPDSDIVLLSDDD